MNRHESPHHWAKGLQYLQAVEDGDIDLLERLWQESESEPLLVKIFCEINAGILEEEGLRPQWDQLKETALASLARRLPWALAEEPLPASLTVGNVASRIVANDILMRTLSPADRQANASLQQNQTPLPADLGIKKLLQFVKSVGVNASDRYWREFQQTAMLTLMSQDQTTARAAARSAGKPPSRPSLKK